MKNFDKMMILGTGSRGESGDVNLTKLAEQRVHRAIGEAARQGISLRSKEPVFLISGWYSKKYFDSPPSNSEAKVMADFALRIYGRDGLTADAIEIEEQSTTTEENVIMSLEAFPDFFAETIACERQLGIVSHESHVEWATSIAEKVLPCSPKAIAKISIREVSGQPLFLPQSYDQAVLTGDE